MGVASGHLLVKHSRLRVNVCLWVNIFMEFQAGINQNIQICTLEHWWRFCRQAFQLQHGDRTSKTLSFINVKIEEPYRQELGSCHPDLYIRTPPPVFAITISQRWRCWRLLGGGWTNTQDSTLVHSNKIKWHFTNVSHSSAVFWVWVRVCLSQKLLQCI